MKTSSATVVPDIVYMTPTFDGGEWSALHRARFNAEEKALHTH
jgi:hypothetical protein